MILNGNKGPEAPLDGSVSVANVEIPEGSKTESFLKADSSLARPATVRCDTVT